MLSIPSRMLSMLHRLSFDADLTEMLALSLAIAEPSFPIRRYIKTSFKAKGSI